MGLVLYRLINYLHFLRLPDIHKNYHNSVFCNTTRDVSPERHKIYT